MRRVAKAAEQLREEPSTIVPLALISKLRSPEEELVKGLSVLACLA